MQRLIRYLSPFALLFPLVTMAELKMYVPTGEANDIVIIDLKSDTITGHIPELQNAHGLAAGPNGAYLVAGSMQQGGAGETTKPAAVSEAEHAEHHAAGSKASTANASSYVSIVDPIRGRVTRRIAVRGVSHHTAVSPRGNYAIAVHSGAGGISVIDVDRSAVIKAIQTGRSPNYALFSGDGDRVYVSNAFSGTVNEIDTQEWVIKRTFESGKEPEHMVLAHDGKTLYVANVGEGQVAAVDLKSGSIRKRFPIGPQPHGIDISDDGRWLFATSTGGGKLVRVDLNTGGLLRVELQPAPYHIVFVGALGKLYVSSRKEPTIWVIDPQSLAMRGVISIGKGIAHQMVILNH